jgi:cell division septum initiation protein DivIVA
MAAPLPSRATTPSGSIPRSPAPRPTEAGRPGRPSVDLSLVVGRRVAPDAPVIDEPFAVAFRGYDRQQVDERIEDLKGRAGKLRIRAEAAEAELNAALSRLKEVAAAPPAESESGFGVRVEKVLRLAEQEAADVRTKAAKEASEVLERARAEAEAHRHEVEQSLIARVAQLDHEAARRTAALNEREQEIADKLAAAREEADAIRSEAERDAAAEVGRADERAKRLVADAEKAAQQQREAAEREVARLAGIRDEVRSQMADLQQVLVDGLGNATGPTAKRAAARA